LREIVEYLDTHVMYSLLVYIIGCHRLIYIPRFSYSLLLQYCPLVKHEIVFVALRWDIPIMCVNIKHDVDDSQTQINVYLLNACVQDSNNYMFRPFLVAIIRLYIPSSKSMYCTISKLDYVWWWDLSHLDVQYAILNVTLVFSRFKHPTTRIKPSASHKTNQELHSNKRV
jgi:hypothetical protein